MEKEKAIKKRVRVAKEKKVRMERKMKKKMMRRSRPTVGKRQSLKRWHRIKQQLKRSLNLLPRR